MRVVLNESGRKQVADFLKENYFEKENAERLPRVFAGLVEDNIDKGFGPYLFLNHYLTSSGLARACKISEIGLEENYDDEEEDDE